MRKMSEEEKLLLGRALFALNKTRNTIKALHGEIGWEQYQSSPEMKLISTITQEISEEVSKQRKRVV